MNGETSIWRAAFCALILVSAAGCSGGGGGGGAPTFSKSFGGLGDDGALRATPTSDGGYLMTGFHGGALGAARALSGLKDHDGGQLWVTRLDAYGDVVWDRTLGLEPPVGQADLKFLLARRASDGSTYVAYQDLPSATLPTGDPNIDGRNVVITRYAPSGVELWTATLDSGAPTGFVLAGPRDTTEERVLDLWPTLDGSVRVAARTLARAASGQQVHYVEGLWLLKLSSTGVVLSNEHRFNPDGEDSYLGGSIELTKAFVRDFSTGEHMVVVTGKGGTLGDRARTEVLSYATTGLVQNRNIRTMLTNDIDTWDIPASFDYGLVLAGRGEYATGGQSAISQLDIFGLQVNALLGPDREYDHIAARARLDAQQNLQVEYFVGFSDTLDLYEVKRLDSNGNALAGVGDAEETRCMGYDPSTDTVWRLSSDSVRRYDASFFPIANATQSGTEDAWLGPGGPSIDMDGLLWEVAADGSTPSFVTYYATTPLFEGGMYCAERADGGFLVGALMHYDPELPVARDPHIWLLGLDADGAVEWQRSFDREGRGIDSEDLVPVPMLEAGDGLVAGLGASRVARFDAGHSLVSMSEELPGVVTALAEDGQGGYIALLGGSLMQQPFGIARLDGALSTVWSRAYSHQGPFVPMGFFPTPTSVLSLDGTFLLGGTVPFGALDGTALMEVGGDGARLRSKIFRLGSQIPLGDSKVVESADGGYLVGLTVSEDLAFAETGYANWLLVKLDEELQPLWYRLYGGAEPDYLNDLVALDTGYLVSGQSYSLGEGCEAWILRTDLSGDVAPGCAALIEGGPWPASDVPLVQDQVESAVTPGPPTPAPAEALVQFVPAPHPALTVARQCSGSAEPGRVEPPRGGGGGGGGSGEFTLTIELHGGGVGSVSSSPGSLDCFTTCQEAFPAGTDVLLAPRPDPGFFFSHWTGVDVDLGIEGARVTMNADRTVQAWIE